MWLMMIFIAVDIVRGLKELEIRGSIETTPTTAMLRSIRFGLVSLFHGISTFVGYLIPKPFS